MTEPRIVTTFQTKNGLPALLRYPKMADAPTLLQFINTFSKEDKFTRFSGEQLTIEEESEYLSSEIAGIKKRDVVKLFCFIQNEFAGVCDVHRSTSQLTRELHVGVLGLIVAKKCRGQGVGEQLVRSVLSEVSTQMPGIKLVKLSEFASNSPAIALYKKIGFVEVGKIPGGLLYRGKYEDEIIMVKQCEH